MNRFQFVWWGRRGIGIWYFHRLAPWDPYSLIYSWRLSLGPFEIRRWVDDMPAALERFTAARSPRP